MLGWTPRQQDLLPIFCTAPPNPFHTRCGQVGGRGTVPRDASCCLSQALSVLLAKTLTQHLNTHLQCWNQSVPSELGPAKSPSHLSMTRTSHLRKGGSLECL